MANNNFVSTPFWKSKSPANPNLKNIIKQIFRYSKLLFFTFMIVIGLWGCFQTSFDSSISQNPNLGCGLEYGYRFGTTGNYNFDLCASFNFTKYSTFVDWSMAYGPFYAFFIWPSAYCITNFMYATRSFWGDTNALLAIFLLLLLIRFSTLLLSFKSTLQNEKMTILQSKIAKINNKYKNMNDLKSKQMKQYEIQEMYKKMQIKPFASFQQIFITMPIFLIIYQIVKITRPIKAANLFNIWSFSANPLTEIFSNFKTGWVYIFLLIIIVIAQIFSIKLPKILAKKRSNELATNNKFSKTKLIQIIPIIIMIAFVIFSPCGVGIYYCLSSIFSMVQSFIFHKIFLKKKKDKFNSTKINFDF